MTLPRISSVMCTVGRPDSIARAVESVLANDYPDFELVVIDQSADDLTERACAPFVRDPRFRYVHSDKKGLSRSYNLGIASSNASIIAFTDDDCVARPDWLRSVAGVFADNPDVDMLYGQTLEPEGHLQSRGVIPSLEFAEPKLIGPGTRFQVIGMGANFALRRSLVDRIGGFDEALGGGGPLRSSQDFDYQFRAYRAGATVRLSPEPKVDHYGLRTQGDQWSRTLEAYGVGDGAFYWKHVRCGDLLALRLLSQRIGKLALREAVNPLRRKASSWPYLRSCFSGIRQSMRFKVSRAHRMYILREGTA